MTAPAYKNPDLPISQRVEDLLGRMTVQEKAAQMAGMWQNKKEALVDSDGRFDLAKAQHAFPMGEGLGQVGRPNDVVPGGLAPRQTAELCNAIQRFFIEHSRLGIPVVFHEECLHGYMGKGATSFPQPIALASTFDPELVQAVYHAAGTEARACGIHQSFTPVLDVIRDPRWGRVEETFGEDPFLVTRFGLAAVRGLQGDNRLGETPFEDPSRVMATVKHFAAHGQPESGMNCAPVNVSRRVLYETFLPPFKQVLQQTGVISVMAAYHELDGVPCHANTWLLRDLLRDQWGFQGYVVSDYFAIQELYNRPEAHGHFVAENEKAAALLAVRAGVNIELPEPFCYKYLPELVEQGALQESELDQLIAPMLHSKFAMGLFDQPYTDPEQTAEQVHSAAHQSLARRAARECLTLLKNDAQTLPLDKNNIQTIAVIGPNAHRPLLGGYSAHPPHSVTLLEGIRAQVGDQVKVLYAKGCDITVGGDWWTDPVILPEPEDDRAAIAEAVGIAQQADVVILAVGDSEQTSRESFSRDHLGDRTSLDMVGAQDALADALVATGKPVIGCLIQGRPLAVHNLVDKLPALLACWHPGQAAGHGIAEVLFGAHNPSGKLPISVPRSVGHIPAYYNHKPSARRGYLFDQVSPLFAFGYGLSYSQFKLENIRLEATRITSTDSTRVLAQLSNTGAYPGSEVVQLYIRDCVSSVTRPVKELKGFTKVFLQPGETRSIALEITPDSLAFYGINMDYTVEPGLFEIMLGTSSRDEDLTRLELAVVA